MADKFTEFAKKYGAQPVNTNTSPVFGNFVENMMGRDTGQGFIANTKNAWAPHFDRTEVADPRDFNFSGKLAYKANNAIGYWGYRNQHKESGAGTEPLSMADWEQQFGRNLQGNENGYVYPPSQNSVIPYAPDKNGPNPAIFAKPADQSGRVINTVPNGRPNNGPPVPYVTQKAAMSQPQKPSAVVGNQPAPSTVLTQSKEELGRQIEIGQQRYGGQSWEQFYGGSQSNIGGASGAGMAGQSNGRGNNAYSNNIARGYLQDMNSLRQQAFGNQNQAQQTKNQGDAYKVAAQQQMLKSPQAQLAMKHADTAKWKDREELRRAVNDYTTVKTFQEIQKDIGKNKNWAEAAKLPWDDKNPLAIAIASLHKIALANGTTLSNEDIIAALNEKG